MMNEYCINGLTIKENLLRLAGEGNKKFTESLHPGIENVLGVRVPALRQLAAQIAKDDWQAYLQSADTFYMEERMLQGMVIGCLKIKDVEEYLSLVSGFVSLINSWSVCDTFDFAGKQRFVDRNKERVWQFLEGWMQSDKEYEIRFGVGMAPGIAVKIFDGSTVGDVRIVFDNSEWQCRIALSVGLGQLLQCLCCVEKTATVGNCNVDFFWCDN